VSTADHCQAGPLGRRAADLRDDGDAAFFVVFVALLVSVALLLEVFDAFFEALFFFAVFFATSHLLKLRRGGY
jgi:hypothetical protein